MNTYFFSFKTNVNLASLLFLTTCLTSPQAGAMNLDKPEDSKNPSMKRIKIEANIQNPSALPIKKRKIISQTSDQKIKQSESPCLSSNIHSKGNPIDMIEIEDPSFKENEIRPSNFTKEKPSSEDPSVESSNEDQLNELDAQINASLLRNEKIESLLPTKKSHYLSPELKEKLGFEELTLYLEKEFIQNATIELVNNRIKSTNKSRYIFKLTFLTPSNPKVFKIFQTDLMSLLPEKESNLINKATEAACSLYKKDNSNKGSVYAIKFKHELLKFVLKTPELSFPQEISGQLSSLLGENIQNNKKCGMQLRTNILKFIATYQFPSTPLTKVTNLINTNEAENNATHLSNSKINNSKDDLNKQQSHTEQTNRQAAKEAVSAPQIPVLQEPPFIDLTNKEEQIHSYSMNIEPQKQTPQQSPQLKLPLSPKQLEKQQLQQSYQPDNTYSWPQQQSYQPNNIAANKTKWTVDELKEHFNNNRLGLPDFIAAGLEYKLILDDNETKKFLFHVNDAEMSRLKIFLQEKGYNLKSKSNVLNNNLKTYREVKAGDSSVKSVQKPPVQQSYQPNKTNFGSQQQSYQPNNTNFGSQQQSYQPNKTNFASQQQSQQPNKTNFASQQQSYQPNNKSVEAKMKWTIDGLKMHLNMPTLNESILIALGFNFESVQAGKSQIALFDITKDQMLALKSLRGKDS